MDKFLIEGGRTLLGDVTISGSKNAALPMLAATLLAAGESTLTNVPDLVDIRTMKKLLENLGAKVKRDGDDVTVDASTVNHVEATYDIVSKMRATIWVLGPLLVRFGRARVSLPGGCAIGARPIDLHLKGLEALGAQLKIEHGYVDATAPRGGLVGATIVLDLVSVGATIQLMLAASLANGTTIIENAAGEPEIYELANMLNAMGARIKGAGTSAIEIEGVDSLRPVQFSVGPDRIESGTFIAAAAITGSEITLRNVLPYHLDATIAAFRKAGCEFEFAGADKKALTQLKVTAPMKLQATDIRTAPFPGYATDMQAQFMACMAVADGSSHIEETIYENRFMHALELMRMGADISIHGHGAMVKGIQRLSGAQVMATDLRASASLVLAGLAADGITEISRIYHLDRGYVALEKKLSALGANVQRIS